MAKEILFDPSVPGYLEDPYPFYARLRELEPWHRTPKGMIVVSRYEDASSVLRDRRFGKVWNGPKGSDLDRAILELPIIQSIKLWMIEQNQPDHSRLRACFTPAFAARHIEVMRQQIESIVEGILDEVGPRNGMDVVSEFALPVPMLVITRLMGVPSDDMGLMFKVSRFIGRLSDPVPLDPNEVQSANKDFVVLSEYFRDLIERRRREPKEDLISQIAIQDDRMSIEEMIGNLALVFVAGHETTTSLICNALLALDRHPDQLQMLRKDPSLMPKAVEEFLRYDNPIQIASRTAMEDFTIGAIDLSKGDHVLILLGAANRDPAIFSEPDRLKIDRSETQLVSFGGGIHHCIGAQLSRIEAECALAALYRKLPNFRLIDTHATRWRRSIVMRGPEQLPAMWNG
jgi:cytochrome P450